jgi:hypothetical protein
MKTQPSDLTATALRTRIVELERVLRDLLNDYQQEHRQLTDGEYEFKSPAISRARSALGLCHGATCQKCKATQ